jgi:hypothetical protein
LSYRKSPAHHNPRLEADSFSATKSGKYPAKSGRTQFAGQFACAQLSSLGGKRSGLNWIFDACGSSLAQPEHENHR